jgi:sialidase-1
MGTTTPKSPAILPGTSQIILQADDRFPRYSEADVIELTDGRLLLSCARKDGASDFAPGTLIGLYSRDSGLTWDHPLHVIQAPFGDRVDLMSVSFCRTEKLLHLFFLARGKDAKGDTHVYQMRSKDEGQTWDAPTRVTERPGYYVVNNSRVIRTSKGRLLIPPAYTDRIDTNFNAERVFTLYSDDDGVTWHESNMIGIPGQPMMEPGVAECADGSFYMTIRTQLGVLYEARSTDSGKTWDGPIATKLPAPAAPSTSSGGSIPTTSG